MGRISAKHAHEMNPRPRRGGSARPRDSAIQGRKAKEERRLVNTSRALVSLLLAGRRRLGMLPRRDQSHPTLTGQGGGSARAPTGSAGTRLSRGERGDDRQRGRRPEHGGRGRRRAHLRPPDVRPRAQAGGGPAAARSLRVDGRSARRRHGRRRPSGTSSSRPSTRSSPTPTRRCRGPSRCSPRGPAPSASPATSPARSTCRWRR